MDSDLLDLCSQEPIHTPGAIQSHGMLVVMDEGGVVHHCSTNIEALTGISCANILGGSVRMLNKAFGKDPANNFLVELVSMSWHDGDFRPANPYQARIGSEFFNVILSHSAGKYVVDFEPQQSDLFQDPQNKVGASLSHMLADNELQSILENAVQQTRHIIGYDRVMIYKFHQDGHGEVIAEDREGELESWLGLHYPASDIPQQARELYKRNFTRLIANVHEQPIAIASLEPATVDLSDSSLRAVSPVHIRYLKNMKVDSSFSVSIIVEGELWGLIACHNYSPRYINYRQRETAKLVGQVLSSCIAMRSQESQQKELLSFQAAVMEIVRSLQKTDNIADIVQACGANMLKTFDAVGFAFYFEGELYGFGHVPEEKQITLLSSTLVSAHSAEIFATDHVSSNSLLADLGEVSFAGIMACQLTAEVKDYLFLFRDEKAAVVRWAGKPDKMVEFDDKAQPFISPRNSFEQWLQEVRGYARPWSATEQQIFIQIRDEIKYAVARKVNELRKLNEKLREAYAELDSFAHTVSHDLKTPLTAIKAYAELIQRKSTERDVQGMAGKIKGSAEQLTKMVQTVLEYAKVGQKFVNKEHVDMSSLLWNIRENLLVSKLNEHLQLNILATPPLEGDPILIFQVFLNVIENAVKYSHKVIRPIVSVEGTMDASYVVYRISDNGVGINAKQQEHIFGLFNRIGDLDSFEGSGVGLATVKKIMSRHGAQITVESQEGLGSTFILKFPRNSVA